MPATFEVQNQIPQGRRQNSRRVEIPYHIDFATIGDGTGLAAGESAHVADIPAGFIFERIDPILRTAEGEVATVDIGDEDDPNGFLSAGNMNGTANAAIALAGSEAYGAGKYYHTAKELWVSCPAAANTLNVGAMDFMLVGYMADTE